MASSTVCTSCLRALRQQTRQQRRLCYGSSATISQTRSARLHQQQSARLLSTPSARSAEEHFSKSTPPLTSGPLDNIAATLRKSQSLQGATEPYVAYGVTEELLKACSLQCDYTIPAVREDPPKPAPKNAAKEDVGVGDSFWYRPKPQGLALDVTFNTWAQITFLHMYLVTVRLRRFPKDHVSVWHQNLLDHFFYAAEDRMAVWHGMTARGTRNKYLKDLWSQWRGVQLSYDEGLIKGDAILGAAVWRNVFKAREDVDVQDVALVVGYMRHQLQMLDELENGEVAAGTVKFGNPGQEKAVVVKQSPWMHKSFSAEDLRHASV